MSDPDTSLKTRYDAFVERNAKRGAARTAADASAATATAADPGVYQLPLERLYERFDAVATGRANAHGADLHAEMLARLATNRAYAEAAGWTECALERDGGTGRLRVVGVAPDATERSVVPDWTAGVAAGAASRLASER